ncbi:MAG: hypothetical protein K2Q20_00750 [Phycisphaerales bacterium]|nr:hypothetical protein [Phycisphaerales bacterium]
MTSTRSLSYSALTLLALAVAAPAAAASTALTFQPPVSDQASGEPAAKLPEPTSPAWTVEFEPTVWFAGPSGKLRLPVTSGTGPGGFTTEGDEFEIDDLNLDTTRVRPKGAFRLGFEDWQVSFSGADYSSSRSVSADVGGRLGSVAFAAGERLDTDFSLGAYELTLGYCVWDKSFTTDSKDPAAADDIRLRLYVLGGVRLTNVDISVSSITGPRRTADVNQLFAEPILGARLEADLTESFGVNVLLTGGYLPIDDRTSSSVDIEAAFYYRPTAWLGIEIGYRQLAFSLEDGEGLGKFEYDGRLAGLFTGVTLRF